MLLTKMTGVTSLLSIFWLIEKKCRVKTNDAHQLVSLFNETSCPRILVYISRLDLIYCIQIKNFIKTKATQLLYFRYILKINFVKIVIRFIIKSI